MAQATTKAAIDDLPLAERLQKNPDGILEQIAKTYAVSTLEVVRHLPTEHCAIIGAEKFAEVMQELTAWGEIVFIVHTDDIVCECVGSLPPGTFGRGYYNLHGDSPIGGHIRVENCASIAFVARPFMGRESRSVQFFNEAGEAMFKVFVRRDKERNLLPEQVEKFDALRARMIAAAS